jgi:hypothetical protein
MLTHRCIDVKMPCFAGLGGAGKPVVFEGEEGAKISFFNSRTAAYPIKSYDVTRKITSRSNGKNLAAIAHFKGSKII